jgi:hypothetical protein
MGSISRFDESVTDMFTSTTLHSEVLHVSLVADEYKLSNSSFAGVCDTLVPEVHSADGVECNDSETAWALSASVGEDRWCADTMTPAKQVYTALEDKLSCVELEVKADSLVNPAVNDTASSAATTTQ